ncbi:hypothetical protein [Rhodovulum sp. P5]|uniref:hypothetical protein n=1 Tax=Rhodovulum sp. P5 TaxID=1564506 RepID=UPI0009D96319|nr:hypothetical protein [Rhodovulum sp. P5]
MERHHPYLIVTNKRDLTSDFIVREIRNRGLPFHRLNTEDVAQLLFTQRLGDATTLCNGDTQIKLDTVRAAYFRRPLPPEVKPDGLSHSSVTYIREEWSYLLRSLYLELGEKWFNHPNSVILAEDKPRQLRLAQEVGFTVPETVITNELDSVERLFSDGDVIAKPMKQSLLEDPSGPGSVIYTTTIHSIEEIDPTNLRVAPVIFQRRIDKRFDLRVTVVETRVFAVAINSQKFAKTETDWRHSSVTELEHEVFELPEEVAKQCVEVVRRLNLRYGAIDLVLDASGAFWFLECNPNGQWAWIENRTGLPIAAAIVTAMENISK